ncbi:MAG: cadmium-translocating P-type ATPase [Lachnospiraceae bacterium]|nr:cadmium-translocating P-type ATPase [Lachnospiraceae bacterium]
MTKKQKRARNRIIHAFLLFLVALFITPEVIQCLMSVSDSTAGTISLCLYLIAYFAIGGDVVKKAAQNIFGGQIFDENFLMTLATVGAFFVGEYPEAVAVMLFYQVGELFQSYAVDKSRKSIAEMMDICPEYANLMQDDKTVQVAPQTLKIGDVIVVKPGEKIPVDGTVLAGQSTLDTSALTGESVPSEVLAGNIVYSGSVNQAGMLEIRVDVLYENSTVKKILDLVENAGARKAKTEKFITKFARVYTPAVVMVAVLLAVVPSLMVGNPSEWIYRALTFLVISCPCALVISVPMSFFAGLGAASKRGILIKGSNYLELLGQCKTFVFDKTGTLTKGNFAVTKCFLGAAASESELLTIAAGLEKYSNHPIAKSICEAAKKAEASDAEKVFADDLHVSEQAGFGMETCVSDDIYVAGNLRLMRKYQVEVPKLEGVGTFVYVAKNQTYLGAVLIQDELKETSAAAIAELAKTGVTELTMLTGDRREIAEEVGKKLGIRTIFADLLPNDKMAHVESMLAKLSDNEKLAFVGDGMNDAPVLARADVGIAMGGIGSDAAIEAADVVLMKDNPMDLVIARRISGKTMAIVKQNIWFAIGIKLLVLFFAALGFASMWAAVFADVGVAVLAILNALRAMHLK